MIVKCLFNTGKYLVDNKYNHYGIFEDSRFDYLKINQEYIVNGILTGNGIIKYLIDEGTLVFACHSQLFKIVDYRLSSNWFFKIYSKNDKIYPYRESVMGYSELVFEEDHYSKLVDLDKNALGIYFKRKIEIEKEINTQNNF